MPARVQGDPDKYIRLVKGGRYQARPYDPAAEHMPPTKRRYTIPGTFATKDQARRAIREFWWGRVAEVAYGTRYHPRRVADKSHLKFAALIIQQGRVVGVLSWHATREEAAQAFARNVRSRLAKARAAHLDIVVADLLTQAARLPKLEEPCESPSLSTSA